MITLADIDLNVERDVKITIGVLTENPVHMRLVKIVNSQTGHWWEITARDGLGVVRLEDSDGYQWQRPAAGTADRQSPQVPIHGMDTKREMTQ